MDFSMSPSGFRMQGRKDADSDRFLGDPAGSGFTGGSGLAAGCCGDGESAEPEQALALIQITKD
jgi:hypothetical protein